MEMSERANEIAELAKDILGNILQGILAGGGTVAPEAAAKLAVQSATALVDKLAAEQG
jgi:hypothetical protein